MSVILGTASLSLGRGTVDYLADVEPGAPAGCQTTGLSSLPESAFLGSVWEGSEWERALDEAYDLASRKEELELYDMVWPSEESLNLAEAFVRYCIYHQVPPPDDTVPSGDGGVCFRWYWPDGHVLIEIEGGEIQQTSYSERTKTSSTKVLYPVDVDA